jgi:hypothetical protein
LFEKGENYLRVLYTSFRSPPGSLIDEEGERERDRREGEIGAELYSPYLTNCGKCVIDRLRSFTGFIQVRRSVISHVILAPKDILFPVNIPKIFIGLISTPQRKSTG